MTQELTTSIISDNLIFIITSAEHDKINLYKLGTSSQDKELLNYKPVNTRDLFITYFAGVSSNKLNSIYTYLKEILDVFTISDKSDWMAFPLDDLKELIDYATREKNIESLMKNLIKKHIDDIDNIINRAYESNSDSD